MTHIDDKNLPHNRSLLFILNIFSTRPISLFVFIIYFHYCLHLECLPLNPCKMTQHNCSKSANCKDIAAGKFSCTCTAGYAGDGFHCGNDTDADGIPDYALLCSGRKSCKKDNCISIPNSGQEDADRDGIG